MRPHPVLAAQASYSGDDGIRFPKCQGAVPGSQPHPGRLHADCGRGRSKERRNSGQGYEEGGSKHNKAGGIARIPFGTGTVRLNENTDVLPGIKEALLLVSGTLLLSMAL